MTIRVTFDRGRVSITPEVAYVKSGETVSWQCVGVAGAKQQEWTFRFPARTPFKSPTFSVQSPRASGEGRSGTASQAQYMVQVSAGAAEESGDYKYDVELAEDGKPLIEVDPRIVVE